VAREFALKFEIRRGDVKNLTERLLNLSDQYPLEFRRALFAEAEQIIERAKSLAPYRTGRLYRSGRAYWPSERDPRINVQFLAPYALVVHETHATKSKFLERALNAALSGMARRLARRIVEATR
jgi:hypothetical protein